MTINTLYPAVNPTLNLDFSNTKVLDPRITFGRASSAMSYDGKTTVMAEQNLIINSQDISASQWAYNATAITRTANVTTAPDGTTTASSAIGDGTSVVHYFGQNITLSSSYVYTFSFFAKANGVNYIQNFIDAGSGYANFDLLNGVVGSFLAPFANPSITAVGNGWYRCTVSLVNPTNSSIYFALSNSATAIRAAASFATGSNGVYLWGFQLEQRAYATAYTPTTTAAITNYIPALQSYAANVARFDFNPVTGESLGLMVEEQRTNLLTYSQDFWGGLAWTGVAASVQANCAIAPDGTFTADKLTEDSTTATHYLTRAASTSVANATVYTASMYVKALGQTTVRLQDTAAASAYADFNLSTLAITNQSNGVGTITSVGNGWYRISMTYTSGGTTALIRLTLQTGSYAGNGYSGVLIWGAQLEAGAFATSYIPTLLTYSGRGSVATYIGDNGLIQTAAANVARYQRNIAGAVQLLLEGAGSNLLTYSQRLNVSAWTQNTGAICVPNVAIAPDGTMTGQAVYATGSSSHWSYQSSSGASAGQQYTLSAYFKKGSTQYAALVEGGDASWHNVYVDLNAGTISGTSNATGTITPVGNGWYRVTCTITRTNAGNFYVGVSPATAASGVSIPSFAATGSEYVYAWGLQLEAGAVATSYIPSSDSFTSRSGSASYYDSGTTAVAEQNLALQSQAFDNASWSKSAGVTVVANAVVAPDGTTTADTITLPASGVISQATSLATTGTYTISVWMKCAAGATITFGMSSPTYMQSCTVTSSWQRFTYTGALAVGNWFPQINNQSGSSADVDVWGFQIELRGSVTDYVPTTTAPITNYIPRLLTAPSGLARYDFDPVTRLSKGLLLESARTNLLTYSDQFDNAAYSKTNLSVTANAIIAPDGILTADKLIASTASGVHVATQLASTVSSTVYTLSVFAKAGEITAFRLMASSLGAYATADLSAGTVSGAGAGYVSSRITPVGNGWYRVSVTYTEASTASNSQAIYLYSSGTSFTGTGWGGLYIWGMQLEPGYVATSYISTTTAQVTRAADVGASVAQSRAADVWSSAQATRSADLPRMTGTNFSSWYRQDEGTLFINGQSNNAATAATYTYAVISDGTTNNVIQVAGTAREVVDSVNNNGSSLLQVYTGFKATYPFSFTNALAFKNNDFQAYNNGSSLGSASAGRAPVMNRLDIGSNYAGTAHAGHMTIKRIAFYPKRIVAAEQAGLTS